MTNGIASHAAGRLSVGGVEIEVGRRGAGRPLPRPIGKAVAYAGQRVAFGAPIAEHQAVSFPLAESAMRVHAAHLMGLTAAILLDRGERAITRSAWCTPTTRCG